MNQFKKIPWRILIVGGSSGTGKTQVAGVLARLLGTSVVQADDLRLALQAITTEETHPDLHRYIGRRSAATFRSPDSVLEGHVRVAEAIEPAVRVVMSHHIDVAST